MSIDVTSIATHPAAQQGSPATMMLFLAAFMGIFYFLLIRPQSKKRKELAKLVSDLAVGDDVMTIAGIMGRITKINDGFFEVMIAKDVVVTMQKNAVANVLPKGTFEA